MKKKESIVFNLQPNEANQALLFKTFNLINKIYVDNFLNCRLETDEKIEDFESKVFENLQNEILSKGRKTNFNILELILLLKSMKFVSKYFELNPENKLFEILKAENYPKYLFPDNKEFGSNFDYDSKKSWYLKKYKELVKNFNENENNKELLNIVEQELKNFKH